MHWFIILEENASQNAGKTVLTRKWCISFDGPEVFYTHGWPGVLVTWTGETSIGEEWEEMEGEWLHVSVVVVSCCIMLYPIFRFCPVLLVNQDCFQQLCLFEPRGEIDRSIVHGGLGSGPGGPRSTEVSLIGKSKKTGDLVEYFRSTVCWMFMESPRFLWSWQQLRILTLQKPRQNKARISLRILTNWQLALSSCAVGSPLARRLSCDAHTPESCLREASRLGGREMSGSPRNFVATSPTVTSMSGSPVWKGHGASKRRTHCKRPKAV